MPYVINNNVITFSFIIYLQDLGHVVVEYRKTYIIKFTHADTELL